MTYKAVKDSAVFTSDSYMRLLRTIAGTNRRHLAVKEVVIEDYESSRAAELIAELTAGAAAFLERYGRSGGYFGYWNSGIPSEAIAGLSAQLEQTVAYIANSRSQRVIDELNALPIIENLAILHPAANSPRLRTTLKWFLPAGVGLWLLSLPFRRRLMRQAGAIASSELVIRN